VNFLFSVPVALTFFIENRSIGLSANDVMTTINLSAYFLRTVHSGLSQRWSFSVRHYCCPIRAILRISILLVITNRPHPCITPIALPWQRVESRQKKNDRNSKCMYTEKATLFKKRYMATHLYDFLYLGLLWVKWEAAVWKAEPPLLESYRPETKPRSSVVC